MRSMTAPGSGKRYKKEFLSGKSVFMGLDMTQKIDLVVDVVINLDDGVERLDSCVEN